VARAAVDISGMESAALCVDVDSEPSVCAATGPFADQLRSLSVAQLTGHGGLGRHRHVLLHGRDGRGARLPGHEELRTYGAGSLVVLPLRTPVPGAACSW
jgi:hypothetical protein